MINFQKLIEHVLLEQDDQNDDSKQESANLAAFVKTLTDLSSKFKAKYPDTYFPSESEINSIIGNVIYGVPRFDKKFDKFPKFVDIFPLLDLFASLYDRNYKKGADSEGAKNTYAEFIKVLEDKNTPSVPLDFPAQNNWTNELKTAYLQDSKTEVGKATVEDLINTNPNMSFYQAIYRLLEIRKKAFSVKIPDNWKQISGEKFIQDVFFKLNDIKTSNPKNRIAIRDEKIRRIYDDVTSEMLMNVSFAAYKLYEQQVKTNVTPEEKVNSVLKDENIYKQFLGATGSNPIVWNSTQQNTTATDTASAPSTPPSTTQQVNSSFDIAFDLLCKQMINEKQSRIVYGSTTKTETTKHNDGSTTTKTSPISPNTNSQSNLSSKQQENPATKLFASQNEGESLYNLQKLNEAAGAGLEQAKILKGELIKLGNYIKKKAETDWGKAIDRGTQIAKALSFGVPTVGG